MSFARGGGDASPCNRKCLTFICRKRIIRNSKYLEVFDPDYVLERGKWTMGKIEKEKAEIIIRYKKSERPAVLKIFKEDGILKVGLEETFRASRR
jgi:hypothetical protein